MEHQQEERECKFDLASPNKGMTESPEATEAKK